MHKYRCTLTQHVTEENMKREEVLKIQNCCDLNILTPENITRTRCPLSASGCHVKKFTKELLVCGTDLGLDVARNTILENTSVASEIKDLRGAIMSSNTSGIFFPTKDGVKKTKSMSEVLTTIAEIATCILDKDIEKPVERTFTELLQSATVRSSTGEPVIDLRKIDALEGSCGHNRSGRGCDVTSGPCSCGAWH